VAFFIYMAPLVLFEPYFWGLARHPNIQALQNPVKLGVGFPESPVFGEYPFGQFNDINTVGGFGHIL